MKCVPQIEREITAHDLSWFLSNMNFMLGDKWVPVTAAWRVLRLRMEERPPI